MGFEFAGKFPAKFAWMQERKLDFSLPGDCPKFRVNETGTVPFGCAVASESGPAVLAQSRGDAEQAGRRQFSVFSLQAGC